MSDLNTHLRISTDLCGKVIELADGTAKVELTTLDAMMADERGLVHGGFIFGLADFAAMASVNDPNVVLGRADCKFVAPVKVGDIAVAEARVFSESGKKRLVDVTVMVGDKTVLTGELTCFVLPTHVFDQ